MLKLHPNAAAEFNKKAEQILDLVSTGQKVQTGGPGFVPDYYCHAVFEERDIRSSPSCVTNVFGEITSVYLDDQESAVISESDYTTVKDLLESLSKNKGIRNYLSIKTLEQLFHKWACLRYQGEQEDTPFIDYVFNEARELVKKRKILVPIVFLSIQKRFSIGNVDFYPFNEQIINTIKSETLNFSETFHPQTADAMKQFFEERIRKNIQGHTAAVISVHADTNKAYEVAILEVERSLSALRLFSGSMYEPKLFYAATLWGSEHVNYANIMSLDGFRMEAYSKHRIDQVLHIENLDVDMIDSLFENGLGILSDLLKLDKPNKFQAKLIDCLMLYSRSTTAKHLSDKLVYILSSLESLLLKNSQEPIQQNLGERMAFLIAESPQERLRVIKLVKEIYSMRSKFVHHGIYLEGYEEARKFMRASTDVVINLIHNAYSFSEPNELIEALEMKKLT